MSTEFKVDGRTLRVKRSVSVMVNGKLTEIKTRATEQFFIRVSPEVKAKVVKAAKDCGKNISEFVLDRMEEVLANPDSVNPERLIDYGQIKGLAKNEQVAVSGKIPKELKSQIQELAEDKGVDFKKLVLCSLLPMIK